jgi:hypothetical protein
MVLMAKEMFVCHEKVATGAEPPITTIFMLIAVQIVPDHDPHLFLDSIYRDDFLHRPSSADGPT